MHNRRFKCPLIHRGGFSCRATNQGSNEGPQLSPFIHIKCELQVGLQSVDRPGCFCVTRGAFIQQTKMEKTQAPNDWISSSLLRRPYTPAETYTHVCICTHGHTHKHTHTRSPSLTNWLKGSNASRLSWVTACQKGGGGVKTDWQWGSISILLLTLNECFPHAIFISSNIIQALSQACYLCKAIM